MLVFYKLITVNWIIRDPVCIVHARERNDRTFKDEKGNALNL